MTAHGATDAVQVILDLLDLKPSTSARGDDVFDAISEPMPHGRVYGGQVLAQSILAASLTMDDARVPHSMHGYFLRPGDSSAGLRYAVDRIHDGRSFATRRTQAYQGGVPIFSMIASFQTQDQGLDHQTPFPDDVPDPETLTDALDLLRPYIGTARARFFSERAFEYRYIDTPVYLSVEGPKVPRQAVWVRARAALPDDQAIHRAALAYLSDMTLQDSILRAHGIPWASPNLKIASLDHAMWWHRPARADEWLLYVQESPSAQGGRGLVTGRLYTQSGELVASIAQEAMVRIAKPRS